MTLKRAQIALCLVVVLSGCMFWSSWLHAEVTLDQVVSRESPLFHCKTSRLTVGRDGLVYLVSESNGKGFCLRLSRDGKQKLGGEVVYAIHNATANKDGVIATANAHFNHALNLYDAQFNKTQVADDFLVNDTVGWNAPLHVEAGSQSGEFYGLDQHRNRVVRVGVDGKVKGVYAVRPEHVDDWGQPRTFRVSEPLQSFFFLTGSELVRTKFDGSLVWKVKLPVHESSDGNSSGAFDVDDAGITYFIEGTGLALKRLNADGQPLGDLKSPISDLKLEWSDLKPTPAEHIVGLRVVGKDIVLRRSSPTELFQVFDLETGKQKHVESIVFERLTVSFPSLVWTNGEKVPLTVSFLECGDESPHSKTAPPKRIGPRFRVWLTPFGSSDWQELERDAESNIVVPQGYAGLYQLKVSPEVTPRQTAEPSEYLVREIIEVRKPNSQGTIAVVTPLNRSHYSDDERISGRVIVRSAGKPELKTIQLRIRQVVRDQRGQAQLGELQPIAIDEDAASINEYPRTLAIPLTAIEGMQDAAVGSFEVHSLGRLLSKGEYQLEVDVPGFTCVSQRIHLKSVFRWHSEPRTTLYGDYGITFPQRNAWESADAAVAHGERMEKLGFNQFVNRANWQLGLDFANTEDGRGLLNRVKERLQKDPLAVTPEKAEFGSAHHQIAEVYSANGWRELLLLVNMDGGLPIGTGFDTRKPEQFAEAIKRYTEAFASYGAFGGWTWVANWWLYDLNAKFKTPDEKTQYDAALKVARESGKWDPILDQVEDRKFQFAVDAQESFNKLLREVEDAQSRLSLRERAQPPSKVPSDAGNSGASFRGAKGDNEEARRRFTTASAGPYRRPEVLNDINFANVDEIDVQYQAEQITTPDWLHHAVDNAKRRGQPAWTHPELWNDFGTGEQILPMSWLAVMRGAGGIGTAGNVPNWPNVPLDSRSGYHGTTSVFRALNRVIDWRGLGLSVWAKDLVDNDRIGIVVSPRQVKIETFGNGLGSPTFSRQFEAYQSFLYANCAARFVTLEEVRSKEQRREFDALLIVGQTVELEPEWLGYLKQAKAAGIRVFSDGTTRREIYPEAEDLKLKFDVIEKEHSANNDHAFYTYPERFIANADALAPLVKELKAKSKRPKDVVSLVAAQVATSRTESGSTLGMPVVLIRELVHPAARIVFVVNNTPTTLEPGQLRCIGRAISTRSPVVAHLKFDLPPDSGILDLMSNELVEPECVADLRDTYARVYFIKDKSSVTDMRTLLIKAAAQRDEPAPMTNHTQLHRLFGPHLRDVAVSHDGKTALLNAFNWDNNLYHIDLETGRELPPHRVLGQGRIGDHFAYAPKATKSGFFVQGFDLKSAEGYQLFSLESGDESPHSKMRCERRFSLPALPGCLTGWAFTAWIQDRVNNFAVPPSGEWVAGSGNLGIAVWDRSGELLWSEDWSREKRQSCLIDALDDETLLIADGMTLRILPMSSFAPRKHASATDGAVGDRTDNNVLSRSKSRHSEIKLADSGEVLGLHPARDGNSVAVRTSTSGGTVFVIRDGKVAAKLLTTADDLSLSDDGSLIAVTTGHQLRVFRLSELIGPMGPTKSENIRPSGPISPIPIGPIPASVPLSWLAHGDDQLRFPRVSSDGQRIAVSSELGTVSVFSNEGRKLHERDEFSIRVPAWLPNGDLLLVSWMGTVTRVDVEYKHLWRTHVRDGEKLQLVTGIDHGQRVPDVPTSRVTSWIAAESKLPEKKNLLAPNQFIAKFMLGDFAATPQRNVNELVDGKFVECGDSSTHSKTWVDWRDHGMIESGWRGEFALVLDSFNRQLRVDSVTFVEDCEHPESWLRDMKLEYWNADAEKWVFAEYLTSDSVVHHHKLKQPIEAARFRFTKADGHAWPAGNVRLQEVMLHGDVLGASHPDVVAKRPIAVLFDENVASVKGSYENGHNAGLKLATGAAAFSGGNYITLPADKHYSALWQPPFGHMTPNWWFEVVENPAAGQYRYLQFSVKALAPEAKGVTLQVAPAQYGGIAVYLGETKKVDGAVLHQASGAMPFEWLTVTVDLWDLLPENQRGKPFNIGGMGLGTVGGPAAIDRIRLGRTKADLEEK